MGLESEPWMIWMANLALFQSLPQVGEPPWPLDNHNKLESSPQDLRRDTAGKGFPFLPMVL